MPVDKQTGIAIVLTEEGKIFKLNGTLYLDLLKKDKSIILNGSYIIEESDIRYEFSANGDVTYSSNTIELKGRYTTINEKEIQINFTQKEVWDDRTFEISTENVNITEEAKVVDKNTLMVTGEEKAINITIY